MATTVTVQNTLTNDANQPIVGAQVLITLVTYAATAPGYTGTSSVVGAQVATTDSTGTWTAALIPNATITPANTYYRVVEAGYWQSTIVVPASGGPYQLDAVLATPPPTPAAPGITGVQIAASGTVAGVRPEVNLIPGAGVTIAAADNPAGNRVDVTVSSSGAVTSVNGQTGVVSLTAANVGAVAMSGNETIAGTKTFSSAPVVPAAAFPESAVANLPADLSARTVYRGAWAATTAYAPNDLATIGGELLVCITAHTSGSSFSLTNWAILTGPLGRFNVRLYGAAGDGITDDTAAIRAARAAAQSWATSSGTNVAWTWYPPGRYLVTGAPVQGGTTKGNGIFTYPVVATTGQSMIVRDEGPVPATKPLHWQQTTAQTGEGATIIVTSAAGYSATYGQASVFGGPTPEQGYGRSASLFSNAIAEIDNLAIVLPNNPQISGVDCTGMAAMRIGALAVKPNIAPATSIASPTLATQVGVQCPDNNNNDNARIDDLTVYGCYFGALSNEHLVARRITAVYCLAAVEHGRGGDTSHGARIDYLSAENCTIGLGGNGNYPCKIDVGLLDWENDGGGWWATWAVVNDPNGVLLGTVHVTTIGTTHLTYTTGSGTYSARGPAAGLNIRVYDDTRQSGAVAAANFPLPASGVATVNPINRDLMVTAAGGSITGIAVDGQNLGITSGPFILPTCRPYTLTYTGTPTLTATAL